MAWSIFTDGGGDGAAKTWAQDLLAADHAPDTPATEQFIYDWEKSEGGGGKYNPLNQGPVPGHPELTTTASQYGGGAADYASWQAGIQGAVDYLNMPNYRAVQAALQGGNAEGARAALIASPWAESHYGYGSAFSTAPLPGQASALAGNVSGASLDYCQFIPDPALKLACQGGSQAGSALSATDKVFGAIANFLDPAKLVDKVERLGLILIGAAFVIIGVLKFTDLSVRSIVPLPIPGKGE